MSQQAVFNHLEEVLSEKLGASLKITSNRGVGGGCINQAVHIETTKGDFFVKWNSRCASDLFLREADCLEALFGTDNPHVKIPKVFYKSEVTPALPGMIVMEYLPPASGSSRDDELLGRGIAHLHKATNNDHGFHSNTYCGATLQDNTWTRDWVDFFGQRRLWYIVRLIEEKQGMASGEMNTYAALVDRLPELITHNPEPALNHGDLWSGNYIHTTYGPSLIDPASYYADREFDFALMTMFGGFSQRVWQAYHESYPMEAGWRERNQIYELYHILNHQYLFGGGYGRQALQRARRYV